MQITHFSKMIILTSAMFSCYSPAVFAAQSEDLERDAASIPAPPDRSTDTLNPFTVNLDVSTDSSELVLSFASKPKIWRASDGEKQSAIRRSFGFDFSLPLGGKDDLTDKATLNGLSNGAAITGKLAFFGATAKDNMDSPAFLALHARAQANCLDEAQTDDDKKICDQEPRRDFTAKWGGFSEISINRALLSPSWSLVLETSLGWNDFEYIVPLTLADQSINKFQYAFGATYTYYPSDAMSAFSFGAEYQQSYKAGDEKVICKPVVINPDNDCKNGVTSAPQRDRLLILKVESRAVLPLGKGFGELGIAPIGSFDALDDDFGLELPLYWIPPGDSPVLPGIKIGYASKDKDVTLGVFLKTAFSF